MANSNVSKADRLLNSLAKNRSCSLTPEGVNFVRQRFDPYHDLPIKPTGLPDSYDGATITRCLKRTITVSQTSGGGVATTTPWDLHVFNTPLLTQNNFRRVKDSQAQFARVDFSEEPFRYGGLMIMSNNQSGDNFDYETFDTSDSTFLLGTLELKESDIQNNMRVIAQGFEVMDGTANLYQQGVLTCYRQNQPQETDFSATIISHPLVDPTLQYYMNDQAFIIKTPPVNTGAALLIPGSKQWLVKEGSYTSIDYHTNPVMTLPRLVRPCLQSEERPNGASALSTQFTSAAFSGNDAFVPIPGTSPASFLAVNKLQVVRPHPVNQSGIFLSGLHPLATITINCIWYIESAPDGDDEELLTLASASPELDTFALMMVSELRRDSPVAVKLKENYLGEWFVNGVRDIVQGVMPWLNNAQVIGKQIVDWSDQASKNNGMLNPQSFVRGSVQAKVAKEQKVKKEANSRIPKPPPPAPMKRAFRPKVITHVKNSKGPGTKRIRRFTGDEEAKRIRQQVIERANAGVNFRQFDKYYTDDYVTRGHRNKRKTGYSRRNKE